MLQLNRLVSVVVVTLLLGLITVFQAPAASAQADSGNFTLLDWWWERPVIEYRVNLAGAPPGALQAINSAAATWNAIDGSQAELRYVGTTSLRTSLKDGVNTIYWGQLNGLLGQTGMWFDVVCDPVCQNRPTGFDIVVSSNFSIRVGALGTSNFDLETLMVHEFGHALGLGHSDQSQAMFAVITAGTEVRSLAAGDRMAPQIRYPNSNGDLNCDGVVNIVDAYAVAQYVVNLREDSGRCPGSGQLGGDQVFALMGEASGDGVVNIADAYLVARCAVGLATAIC